jgi:hypothetical protein
MGKIFHAPSGSEEILKYSLTAVLKSYLAGIYFLKPW